MSYYQIYKPFSNAKKQVYNGQRFDSGFEARQAQELDLRLKAKEIKSWEAHKRIPLIVNDFHIGDYEIDFVVHHHDGTTEYIETKGRKTEVWSWKWKIFEAMNHGKPNVKMTLVMQRPFKLRKIRKIIK